MMTNTTNPEFTPMTQEDSRARGKMSLTIGLILGALVLSFYAVTIARIKVNMAKRHELEAQGKTVPTAILDLPKKQNAQKDKRATGY